MKAEQKKSEGEQASRIMQAKAFQRSLYQKQKYKHIIVFSAISTLLLCLFILLYYRHVSSKKNTRNLVVREAMITISSNQFLDLITEKAVRIKDKQIGTEIINIADDLMQINALSPLLFHHYGKLYGKIREAYPELTSTECKIYWLYCTKALTIQEIFDLSGLSLNEFNQIWLSIDNKTAKNIDLFQIFNIKKNCMLMWQLPATYYDNFEITIIFFIFSLILIIFKIFIYVAIDLTSTLQHIMHLNLKNTYYLLFVNIFLFTLFSCQKDSDISPISYDEHHILVYMIANNDLYRYAEKNITEIQSGWDDVYNGKIIVFINPPKRASYKAKMMEINKNENKILKEYTFANSIKSNFMQSVISDFTSFYPSSNYSLILWSHGTGWLPKNHQTKLKKAFFSEIEIKSFGRVISDEMDIDELERGIPDKVFSNIIFDACFMGGVEVIHQLKNKAKVIIASPTEILADGFPYKNLTSVMFKYPNKPDLWANTFFDNYNSLNGIFQSATISVIRTQEIDSLVSIVKNMRINQLEANKIQRMDRYEVGVFYDLGNFISLAERDNNYLQFNKQLEKLVIYKANTRQFLGVLDIKTNSGLNCYVPQYNTDINEYEELNQYYKTTTWYQQIQKLYNYR